VTIVFTRDPDGRGGHAPGDGCEWQAVPYVNVGGSTLPPGAIENEQEAPSDVLYVYWCGSDVHLAWLGARNFAASGREVADELVRRVTVLPATVAIRPDSRGVTGIPSMFWVDGYGPQPLTATESAFGLTVAVNIQLVEVAWDFGDGTPVAHAGLGEAWPRRSSVQHTYRDTSGAAPYTVTATLLFQPTYTVNGVAGPTLQPIQVPVTRPYVVHQVQAQRTR
jgi:hypothetical protein